VVFRLGRRGDTEAGGGGAGGGLEVGVSGNELEQVESDVFGTASGEVRALFHGAMVAVEGQVEQLCPGGWWGTRESGVGVGRGGALLVGFLEQVKGRWR